MTLQPGALLDNKYRVVKLIGQGGMGAVYEGNHELIDRRVAIKVLLPIAEQANAVARFEREARAAGRIGNDHILEVLDIGSLADGSRYMVMEFLDGESLASRIESRLRLSEPEVARIALQLLDGLGAAHNAGVLHRDLKPDNIFLVRQKAGHRDFVKIIDFGISKFQALNNTDEMRMTATGTVVGTPYYISPEQAKGLSDVDLRSDLYAVGVILFEALSGRVPFQADNFNNLLFKIVLEEAPPLASLVPDVDASFAAIVHKAMHRDRAERYQTASELAAAVLEWSRTKGVALDATGDAGRPSSLPGERMGSGGFSTTSRSTVNVQGVGGRSVASMTPGAFGASQPVEAVDLPKKKAPVGLIVAGAVGAVAVAATLGMLAMRGGDDSTNAASSVSAEATSVTAARPTPEPAPAPVAPAPAPAPEPAAPPSASASASASAAPEEHEEAPSRATRSSSTRSGSSAARSAAVAPRATATTSPAPAPAAPPASTGSGPAKRRPYFGY